MEHGGDLDWAAARYGREKTDWLDLSTGINPTGYPLTDVSRETWQRLPGDGASQELLAAARQAYGIAAGASLVAAPGTQALLQILPSLVNRARVAVLSPTYGEHAMLWRAAGHEVVECGEPSIDWADVVVLVNPNNPDGRITTPDRVLGWADALARRGGVVVVDEAFADVAPDISVCPFVGAPGLLALRSFGKFFGLAGLRLGVAAGDAHLIRQLKDRLGPWAVSGPALEIGARALGDRTWIDGMRAQLAARAAALDLVLARHGLKVIGGTDLFRLAETPHAARLFQRMAAQAVLVRVFAGQPGWLRFGLPREGPDTERLEQTLAAAMRHPGP